MLTLTLGIGANTAIVPRSEIEGDGTLRGVEFDAPISQSSWVALRILR